MLLHDAPGGRPRVPRRLARRSMETLVLPRGSRAINYSAASNPFALIPLIGSQGVVVQGGANEQHRSGVRWENLLLPRGLERGFISPPLNLSLFAPQGSGERFAKTHKNCFGFKPFRIFLRILIHWETPCACGRGKPFFSPEDPER